MFRMVPDKGLEQAYMILGVDKNASQNEIDNAFRELSKKWHPDVTGGSPDKFQELEIAIAVITEDRY